MPIKKSAADECCAKCEKDIAALRKEIAALKAALAKKPAGGADPRVDKLLEILKNERSFANDARKAGL